MIEKFKVSIIVPIYNSEKYLRECLDSAVNQTLSNIEVILINDGSTDNSLSIAKEYSEKYKFIKLINQHNFGQSYARNRGIKLASGKYIYFLDSDDYIDINAMERLFIEAERNNLDLIMFGGELFFDRELIHKDIQRVKNAYKKKYHYPNIMKGKDCFAKMVYNKDYTCSPCLLFIKRSILIDKQIRFYEGIIHEDELFTFELLFKCNRVKCINNIYFYRRIREGSTTTSKQYKRSFVGCSTVLLNMKDYYMRYKNEKYIRDAISINMGYMFGNAIYNYSYMTSIERSANRDLLEQIKKIAKEMKYFNRKDYRFFCYLSSAYIALRKIYDRHLSLLYKKGSITNVEVNKQEKQEAQVKTYK